MLLKRINMPIDIRDRLVKVFLRFLKMRGVYDQYVFHLKEQCLRGGFVYAHGEQPIDFFSVSPPREWIRHAFP